MPPRACIAPNLVPTMPATNEHLSDRIPGEPGGEPNGNTRISSSTTDPDFFSDTVLAQAIKHPLAKNHMWNMWWKKVEWKQIAARSPEEMFALGRGPIERILNSDHNAKEHLDGLNLFDPVHCAGNDFFLEAGIPGTCWNIVMYVPVMDQIGQKTFVPVPLCEDCIVFFWYLWVKKETLLLPPGYTVEDLAKIVETDDGYAPYIDQDLAYDAVRNALLYDLRLKVEAKESFTGLPSYAAHAQVCSEMCTEMAGIKDYIDRRYWILSGGPTPRVTGSPFGSKLEDYILRNLGAGICFNAVFCD